MGIKTSIIVKFNNLSLIKKLTIALAIPLLIITVASILIYSSREADMAVNDLKQNQMAQIEQIRYNINSKLDDIENVCKWLAGSNTVLDLLRRTPVMSSQLIKKYQVVSDLINDISLSQRVHRIRVFSTSGDFPEQWDYIYDFNNLNEHDMGLLSSIMGSKPVWVGPIDMFGIPIPTAYQITRTDPAVYSCTATISDVDKILGYAMVDISVDDLFGIIETNVDNGGHAIYIVDEYGGMVYSTENAQTIDFVKYIGKYSQRREIIDADYMHVYTYIPKLSCYLVKLVDLCDTYSMINKTQAIFISFSLLLLAVLIIIAHFIIKLMLARMKRMIERLNDLNDSNTSVIEPDYYNDEIGVMSRRFTQLVDQVRNLIRDIKREEALKRKAEFAVMQYQINPHFLYNILDLFQMRAEIGRDYKSADGITQLAAMLRYNTFYSPKTTVKEELEHIEQYVYLQNMRYDNKITLRIKCEEELYKTPCLKFLLQPIVENSIKHGWKDRNSEFEITITVELTDDSVNIEIRDNGAGMTAEQLNILLENLESTNFSDEYSSQKNSIGLWNVYHRLQLQYGDKHLLHIESQPDEYTMIAINFSVNW